ncbi:hypothetical protein ACI2L1_11830 [Streptomyces sp. NPDC019531]|uniref:hypothetical protein n=1 Tax=Streptomyces sp. NPDC019531 TaxID=3365062 RepID=UPI003850AFD8
MTTPTSARHIDIVMTTIGDSAAFFDSYRKLIARQSGENRIRLVVIADRKTPQRFFQVCEEARADGLEVLSPTVEEQDELLAGLGAPTLVPHNSDNRRNIGYLLSWMAGADLLVSVDDDNFPQGDDFFREHLTVIAGEREYHTVESESGWWNPCEMLDVSPMRVYPRGFPYAHRAPAAAATDAPGLADVRVNAGLWLGDPDVDAITRIAISPQVHALNRPEAVLAPGTWAPVNSQNTAIHREAVAAYYFPRMGYRHTGQAMDRYADIFSGYFVQACAKHLGHAVRFGTPLAVHGRNDHWLLRDLQQELPAIAILDDLLVWLQGAKLDGSTYSETYRSLSHQLQDAVEAMTGPVWTQELRGFIHQMAHLMRQWLTVLDGSAGLAR